MQTNFICFISESWLIIAGIYRVDELDEYVSYHQMFQGPSLYKTGFTLSGFPYCV